MLLKHVKNTFTLKVISLKGEGDFTQGRRKWESAEEELLDSSKSWGGGVMAGSVRCGRRQRKPRKLCAAKIMRLQNLDVYGI